MSTNNLYDLDVVVNTLDAMKIPYPSLTYHVVGQQLPSMVIVIAQGIGQDAFRSIFDAMSGGLNDRYFVTQDDSGQLVAIFHVQSSTPAYVQDAMDNFESSLNDAMLSVSSDPRGFSFTSSGEKLLPLTHPISAEEFEALTPGQKFSYLLRHGGAPDRASTKPVRPILGYSEGPQTPQDMVNMVNAIAGVKRANAWVDIERQIMMAYEEFENELLVDLKNRDLDKFRDSLADVLVFLFGVASVSSIDVTADLKAVTDALLSRFDLSMSDAMITHQKYADQGVETQVRVSKVGETEYFVNFSAKDQTGRSGEFIKEGKWLKSYKHHAPTLPELSSIPE